MISIIQAFVISTIIALTVSSVTAVRIYRKLQLVPYGQPSRARLRQAATMVHPKLAEIIDHPVSFGLQMTGIWLISALMMAARFALSASHQQ